MSVRWLCLYLHYHDIPLKQCFCSITTAQFVFPCRVVFCSPYIFLRNFPTLCSHTMFRRNYTLTVQILKISTLRCSTLLKQRVFYLDSRDIPVHWSGTWVISHIWPTYILPFCAQHISMIDLFLLQSFFPLTKCLSRGILKEDVTYLWDVQIHSKSFQKKGGLLGEELMSNNYRLQKQN